MSKEGNVEVADIVSCIALLAEEKVHIDRCKQQLIAAIAQQIRYHQLHPRPGINMKHEVRQWARLLTTFCFVEKVRHPSAAVKQKALETELYNAIALLE